MLERDILAFCAAFQFLGFYKNALWVGNAFLQFGRNVKSSFTAEWTGNEAVIFTYIVWQKMRGKPFPEEDAFFPLLELVHSKVILEL